ncbi:MAG: GGDEF domain-containing protein [Clostridia bacterium]|nr:GGDEF domain-containing protein [Clostridia bacterium]
MKEKIKNELLYGGLTKEQYEHIRGQVSEANRKAVVAWSVTAGLFWLISILLSFRTASFALCRNVYIVAFCVEVVTFLLALLVVKNVKWLGLPAMYLFEASFLGTGIGIALCQPDARTVTMIAAAIIIPSGFIDRTISTVIVQMLTVGSYALLAYNRVAADPFENGLQNLIIFSIAGILVGHIINKARFERYLFADSAKELADLQRKYAYYDQMTGLKNRRAYAEVIDGLYEGVPEDLCVVMVDINGLKATNDTYGHEAGDELIVAASECLASAFEHVGDVYRIGGDEFCVVVNGPASGAERSLDRLSALASGWKGKYINGFSISSGICTAKESDDIERIVVEADHRMYLSKRKYYDDNGVDRGVM